MEGLKHVVTSTGITKITMVDLHRDLRIETMTIIYKLFPSCIKKEPITQQ